MRSCGAGNDGVSRTPVRVCCDDQGPCMYNLPDLFIAAGWADSAPWKIESVMRSLGQAEHRGTNNQLRNYVDRVLYQRQSMQLAPAFVAVLYFQRYLRSPESTHQVGAAALIKQLNRLEAQVSLLMWRLHLNLQSS